ncbi:MAG: type II secretion system protein GspK [Alphaproteobacteria bacterium]
MAEALEASQAWITRLDRRGGSNDRGIYIYQVEWGSAVELASTVSALFGLEGGSVEAAAVDQPIAPTLTAAEIADPGIPLLLARNLVDQTRAEALAEGAIELVMADIARPPPDGVHLGTRTLRLPTGEARVTVTDLGGLVDVNTARPALLERTFRTAGAPPELAAELAAQIAGRRTTTAPIPLLDQLQQLPGMTFPLYQRLATLLTTQGGHQVVDPGVAPPEILLALADLDEGAMQRHLAARAETGRFTPFAWSTGDRNPRAEPMSIRRQAVLSGGRFAFLTLFSHQVLPR